MNVTRSAAAHPNNIGSDPCSSSLTFIYIILHSWKIMKVLTAFNYQHFLLFQAAHLTSTFWSADALEFHRFHWKPPAYLEGSLDHGSIWGSSGITGFLAVDESIEILHHPHHCNHITVSQISKFAFVLGEDIGCWWMLDGPQDPTWQAGIQAVTSWISLTCRNLTKRDHVRGCELLGLERMQQHDSWPQWQDTCNVKLGLINPP